MNIEDKFKPWFTSGAIEFLSNEIKSDDTVIEFGGGMSSLWWANRCRFTLTVEASHSWAIKILTEFSNYPQLLSKWSLKFVPSDWNPTSDQPKSYWEKNKIHLSEEKIDELNSKYLSIDFDPSIIVIDGSIRPSNIESVDRYLSVNDSVRVVIVDNMETLSLYTENRFHGFEKYEFHETNKELIPDHQNGEWCTAVWIKKI